jgi:hypothetical protein
MKTITYITVILILVLTACGKGKDKEQQYEPAFFLPIDLCGATLEEVRTKFLQNGFNAGDTFTFNNELNYPFWNDSLHIHALCQDFLFSNTESLSFEIYYRTGCGYDIEQLRAEIIAKGAIQFNNFPHHDELYAYRDCTLHLLCCATATDTFDYTLLEIHSGLKK